jgi:hypothetical protein
MHRLLLPGAMDPKKPGQIDRKKSDIDVMEHVIGGWYPYRSGLPEPRGHAPDNGPRQGSGRQKASHSRPKLRHK